MRYCIKLIYCRLQITVMHHNENSVRRKKLNKDGEERVKIVRKKVTGQRPTAYYVKEDATYG